ncbi:epsin-1-like isoform X1 [Hyla sarda]|uniref:epsin-1-like isoform X1 n=1 Tax=Hyla sarda TaxID=327740 RepID=UPI0024C42DD3|nr:epsin-1-like isoform X1 [Hyla sarda]XP_056399985.1 epsin-1-like isoform X1 [Hyla sarda]XP_056399986.1 epsin-1-like isoform X1 [Hyla sarda]
MSTSSLRRQMKNIVHNYSEAEIKVREATSNDPWGPSSSLMSEIADLTYNVVAFSEIMSMIWKRLNDHGKNWRHVYKAMTLMEYLIKTGSERVAQQCKENIYAIQTLKDFQYVDRDGKDQGVNVREKAKQLVSLLKDDERLKEERTHALKTKEKLAQTSTSSSASSTLNPATEAEQAWPQSSGEEELQLQLALAMSKEEAEQVRAKPPPVSEEELQLQLALSLSKEEHDKEERIRRGDDLRLQMAIEESKKEAPSKQEESSLMDLADVFSSSPVPTSDPWRSTTAPTSDPWSGVVNTSTASAVSDPWGGPPVATGASTDPWGAGIQTNIAPSDPWAGTPAVSSADAKSVSDPWNPGGAATTVSAQSTDPWSSSPSMAAKQTTDPWTPAATFSDPWGGSPSKPRTNGTVASTTFDQFISSADRDEFSDFDNLRTTLPHSGSSTGELDLLAGEVPVSRSLGSKSPDAFDMAAMSGSLSESSNPTRKTPESFLGPNAALVDLDSLISKPTLQNTKTSNPFLVTGATSSATTNPFQPNQQSSLTLNQLRSSPVMSMGQQVTPAGQTPAAIPFSSVSPMVSVSPMAQGIPLANVSPMVGMQPVAGVVGLPVVAGPPGVSPMGLSAMMPPQQLVTQPLVPNLSAQAVTSTTNPFLL